MSLALAGPRSGPADGREAILAAGALDLFAQRGFHGTVTPLVANLAHVGTRAPSTATSGARRGW